MSDAGSGRPPDGPDVDPGEPLEVLEQLELPASAGFFARLRGKIERRSLTAQILVVSWHLPKMLLLELLEFVFYLLGSADKDKHKGGAP